MNTHLPHSHPDNESVYAGITTWARHAAPGALLALTGAGSAAAVVLMAMGWERLPASGVGITLASIGAWGLLEHRAAPGPRLLQGLFVGLGVAGALLAGFGLLLWIMGPAPIL